MDPSYHRFPPAGEHPRPQQNPPPPKKQVQLQGPRPAALKVNPESHKIKKPPLPPPRTQPVVIYAVSPKIIHTEVSDFMAVVQRLTGLSSGDFSSDGSVSPAARLAATENASPRERSLGGGGSVGVGVGVGGGGAGVFVDHGNSSNIMEIVEDVEVGQFPGILSPVPAMLSPVPSGFFSPVSSDSYMLSFLNEMAPYQNVNGGSSSFLGSPSALFSTPLLSPMPSPDFLNLFLEFDKRQESDGT